MKIRKFFSPSSIITMAILAIVLVLVSGLDSDIARADRKAGSSACTTQISSGIPDIAFPIVIKIVYSNGTSQTVSYTNAQVPTVPPPFPYYRPGGTGGHIVPGPANASIVHVEYRGEIIPYNSGTRAILLPDGNVLSASAYTYSGHTYFQVVPQNPTSRENICTTQISGGFPTTAFPIRFRINYNQGDQVIATYHPDQVPTAAPFPVYPPGGLGGHLALGLLDAGNVVSVTIGNVTIPYDGVVRRIDLQDGTDANAVAYSYSGRVYFNLTPTQPPLE